ncbi:DUF4229 domain-containing protein [Actinoplanes couchii]|uniref:DUF4229 domain-containing protein n=1 Tax=Actinoplanes couchii TaxID=403638 RepID=A0ABQ3XGJ5_9ACTN|nr:DUF4229 domain-containing protein [Actinoplanes couchii]MDR6321116.1 putative membrane protein [Actinoplanes couchii]GID57629.1 hypothetical protein Aco03nite_060330 [Actinoplanes couchii]
MRSVLFLGTARLGLFLVVFLVLTLLPLGMDIFLRALIAMAVSMLLSVFLLRKARQDVSEKLVDSIDRRRAAKAAKK